MIRSYQKLKTSLSTQFYIIFALMFLILPSQLQALKIDLKMVGSEKWIERLIHKYSELEWLLDDKVQYTQEGKAEEFKHSWSKNLKGEHYPEFERTISSVVNLYLIADGSLEAYDSLTKLQPEEAKLSRTSFNRLHKFTKRVLKHISLETIEVNLILGDMGKTHIARQKAKNFGITEPDHDLFLDECLEKCPQIFKSFMALDEKQQEQIKKVAGLVHFGHVTHVEGGPEILTKLKQSGVLKNNSKDFDLAILTQICDVSAARAHEDNRGSKVLTENTFKTMVAVKEALYSLASHSEEHALKIYLSKRAEWLDLKPSKNYLILARLGAMMRLYSQEEGAALKRSYKKLSPQQKQLLNQEMNPLIKRNERTPTYVPAVLVNLLNTYSKQGLPKMQNIELCVKNGVTAIATILRQYRTNKANQPYDPKLTLNFNLVAGQVRDNPDLLKGFTFTINPEGIVKLEKLSEG